jgi:hypothetical protein
MAPTPPIASLAGVLGITLVGPLLLALLPVGDVLGRFPLAWPFQFLLATLIAGLLLGIRWHVIGLVGRAVGAAIDSVDRLSRAQVRLGTDPAGSLRVGMWRAPAIAGVEGLVDLAYLFAGFRLVGVPVLGILRAVLDPGVFVWLSTAVMLLVAVAAVGILVGTYRASGALFTTLVLAIGWAAAYGLPPPTLGGSVDASVVWGVRLAVSAGLFVILLANRATIAERVASVVEACVDWRSIRVRP